MSILDQLDSSCGLAADLARLSAKINREAPASHDEHGRLTGLIIVLKTPESAHCSNVSPAVVLLAGSIASHEDNNSGTAKTQRSELSPRPPYTI